MRWILLALLVALLAFVPQPAGAQLRPDSNAPAGTTDPMWLPDEEWVMERWLPFDEDRLYTALRMTRVEVYWYLKPGYGSVADLARSRSIDTSRLARWLVSNREADVTRSAFRILLARTRRVLSQRHLAEHLLGHPWHRWTIVRHMSEIFGPTYERMRESGVPVEQIALHVDVPPDVLRTRILTRLRVSGQRGVARGEMSRWQAQTIARQDARQVQQWVQGTQPLLCDLRGTARPLRDAPPRSSQR